MGPIPCTAYYDKDAYTVTYDAMANGSLTGDHGTETVLYNESPVEVPGIDAATGYAFIGWSTDGGTTLLSKSDVEATTVTANIDYEAYYEYHEYTVTYDPMANGILTGEDGTEIVPLNGSPVEVPGIDANTGYAFAGWFEEGETTLLTKAQIEATTVTADIKYEAQYTMVKYDITFNLDGHGLYPDLTNTRTESIQEGQSPNEPIAGTDFTVDPGWRFTGWDPTPVVDPVTGTATYTAQYIKTYVITFDPGVGSLAPGEETQTVDQGGAVVEPTPTTPAGYTFDGWEYDVPGFDKNNVTSDANAVAQYTYRFTVIPKSTITNGAVRVTYNGVETVVQPGVSFEITAVDGEDTVWFQGEPDVGYHFWQWKSSANWGYVADNGKRPANIYSKTVFKPNPMFAINTYALTTAVTGNGTLNVDPAGTYNHGDVVDLTDPMVADPVPATGWHFVEWQDAGGNPITSVTMTAATAITAVFEIDTHALTTAVTGNGTLNVDPAGTYNYGDVVDLTDPLVADPVADTGWHFVEWQDAGSNPITSVTMTADTAITAVFEIDTHALTTAVTGNGTLNVDPAGTYDYGTVVDLTDVLVADPVADTGWHFVEWQDAGGNAITSVTMTADTAITAVFEIDTHALTTAVTGNGTLNVDPAATYDYGTIVDLTDVLVADPVADTGWHFVEWQDASGNAITSVTMTADTAITAVFEIDTHALTTAVTGNGTLNVDPAATYDYGTVVDLTDVLVADPVADTGWRFVEWQDAGGNPITSVLIDQAKTITALFERGDFVLTTAITGNGVLDVDPAATYLFEDVVDLTDTAVALPNPDTGWSFSEWQDAGGNAITSVTMTADTTITAVFTINRYTLAVDAENGTVDAGLAGRYNYGTTIALTADMATADDGFEFVEWQDAAGNAITSITMNGNRTVTAVFEAIPVVLAEEEVAEAAPPADEPAPAGTDDMEIEEETVPTAVPAGFNLLWLLLLIPLLGLILFLIAWWMAVVPIAESVNDNGNGTYTITWGYENRKVKKTEVDKDKSIFSVILGKIIGEQPAPPTTFEKGRHENVFNTTVDAGAKVEWKIRSRKAKVDLNKNK